MGTPSIADRLEKLCAIYSLPLEQGWQDVNEPSGPSPYRYWLQLELLSKVQFEGVFRDGKVSPNPILHSFFRSMNAHFPLDIVHGRSICDVGSGYGFMTFWSILSGAAMVYSIGDPVRIGFVERLYQAAIDAGLVPPGRMRFRPNFVATGDTTLHPDIESGTLDLVLMTDTLEHITPRILPSLARAAHNDLREGGLFISRQQNTDSPGTARRLIPVWEMIEREVTFDQRLGIIKDAIPGITDMDARTLAKHTRGLDKPDFHGAVDRYRQDGTLPDHDLKVAPVDVLLDVPAEGDTGMVRIKAVFKNAGFKWTAVYPDLMSSRRSRFLQPLAYKLPGLFFGTHLFDASSVFVMRK